MRIASDHNSPDEEFVCSDFASKAFAIAVLPALCSTRIDSTHRSDAIGLIIRAFSSVDLALTVPP